MIQSGGTTTSMYNPANELLSQKFPDGTRTTYSYNPNANLQRTIGNTGVITTYAWDFENRLIKIRPSNLMPGINTFTYDGEGNRVRRDDSTGTVKPIWDGANILLETDQNDATQVVYTLEPSVYGKILSQIRGTTARFFNLDSLGSTDRLTDISGSSVTDNYIYKAFGEPLVANGTTSNPFRFAGGVGYYYDSDFQQYHLRQRYFLPSTGRFVSVDPLLNGNVYGYLDNDLLNPGLLSNGYCYVGNNPVNGLDPSGLLVGPWELVLIIFTDVAGTVLVTVVIPVIIVVGVGTLIRMWIRYSICSAKFRKCMSRALNKAKDCTEKAVLAARGPIDGTKCATYHKRKFEIGCLGAYSLCLASWFGAFVDPSFECEKCDFPKEDDFDDCETSTIDDCIWNVCRYKGRASGCEVVPPFPPLAPRARCAWSAEVHPQR